MSLQNDAIAASHIMPRDKGAAPLDFVIAVMALPQFREEDRQSHATAQGEGKALRGGRQRHQQRMPKKAPVGHERGGDQAGRRQHVGRHIGEADIDFPAAKHRQHEGGREKQAREAQHDGGVHRRYCAIAPWSACET